MRTIYSVAIIFLGISGSALAVDLTNTDSTAHSVFVCDSTCEPPIDHNYSRAPAWRGKVLTVAAGETISNICDGTCEIVVEDGTLTTIEDLGFSEKFGGSDVAMIRQSFVVRN